MILMNGNRQVLYYNLDDYIIEVLDNEFLPYPLKDFIKSTKSFAKPKDMVENGKYIDTLKDFLSNRVLNISRSNAKAILNSAGLPATVRIQDRLKICHACRGLSITDNFWLKEDYETLTFDDVNLRKKHLYDAAFKVSVIGNVLTISKDILEPDISSQGMFAKTWYRSNSGLELWKTDRNDNKINTKAEIRVSEILDETDVPHVKYRAYEKDGILLAVCSCITDDNVSMISAQDLKDWCEHTGQDFISVVMSMDKKAFSQMVVIDYLISNPDRHLENFAFFIDNTTNEICGMAWLYDHNQALIADVLGNDIADMIYEPTGLTMRESALQYFMSADIHLNFGECRKKGLFEFFGEHLRIEERFNVLKSQQKIYMENAIRDIELE